MKASIQEAKGWLSGGTIKLVTDNWVVESAVYKGNSFENLFELKYQAMIEP